MTDERIQKLPRWAQQEIRRLQAHVEWWKSKALAGEDQPTNTWYEAAHNERRYLEDGARVLFRLRPEAPGDRTNEGVIECRVSDGELRVLTSGIHEMPAMIPYSSNLAKLRLVD